MKGPQGTVVVGMPERLPDDRAVVLIADPWSFPAEGYVARTNTALAGLPIVGGLAASPAPGAGRLFVDGRCYDRGAVGISFGGEVQVMPVVSQGCRPIGPEMTVTRADGDRVLELAGQPAAARLRDVLADLSPTDRDRFAAAPQIGIAVDEYAEAHEHGDFLIRPIVAVQPDTGGITIGDLVQVGQTVRFQVRDAAAANADLRRALAGAAPAGGALLFSCNGRGASLFGGPYEAEFHGASHDARIAREYLHPGRQAAVAGFFAGGEFGPVGGRNCLHGFTASLLTFPAATVRLD
jgi:small ligand-binding sensory domain FIST